MAKKTAEKTAKRTTDKTAEKVADQPSSNLTHLGKGGEARMVDVSAKAATERTAVAEGRVVMQTKTLDIVLTGNAVKGDVLAAARIAGIMAAKRTHQLIPLCHPLQISKDRKSTRLNSSH